MSHMYSLNFKIYNLTNRLTLDCFLHFIISNQFIKHVILQINRKVKNYFCIYIIAHLQHFLLHKYRPSKVWMIQRLMKLNISIFMLIIIV